VGSLMRELRGVGDCGIYSSVAAGAIRASAVFWGTRKGTKTVNRGWHGLTLIFSVVSGEAIVRMER
jgi:hypothetical protein